MERDPPYAWILAGAGFVLMALAFGGLGSVGIFLKPMVAEFAWSRGEAASGYTILSFSAALLGLFWGYFSDRWGCRLVIMLAVIAMPVSLFLLSRVETLWQFYLAYFIFGGFGFASMFSPLMATVGFWFMKHKGLGIGIVASGGAAGQGVIPYCAGLLITEFDWQTAYLYMSIAYLIVGIPLALVIREAPARLAAQTGQRNPPPLDTKSFPVAPNEAIAWISIAAVFCCICMSVPIVHVVSLVSDRGFAPDIAASVLMVIMIAGIPGRLFGGVLGGRFGAVPAYMIFSLGQTLLAFAFPHIAGMTNTYILAVVFGIFYSADMVAILYCLRVMVPVEYAGRALGIGAGLGMVGMGLGGFIGGALYDMTGDYQWSFTAASLAGAVNLTILALFYRRYKQKSMLAYQQA